MAFVPSLSQQLLVVAVELLGGIQVLGVVECDYQQVVGWRHTQGMRCSCMYCARAGSV